MISNRNTALAIGAIALIIGSVGPWINFADFIKAGPLDLLNIGLEDNDYIYLQVGLVVFGGLFVLILSAFTGILMRPVSIAVGLLMLSEVGYVWFGLSERYSEGGGTLDELNSLIQPGWGLYLSALTGLYLLVSTFLVRKSPAPKFEALPAS